MECLICNSREAKEIFCEDKIAVLSCLSCGHVYSSFPGQESYAGYFPDDVAASDHSWWREAHERMYREFRRRYLAADSGRLLDVGCGLGYFLESLRRDPRTEGWEIFGAETSVSAVAFAKEELKLPNIFLGSSVSARYPDNFFDMITLWDVLEHLPNPRVILSDLHRTLRDGGRLFIATPNIDIQLPKARLKKWLARSESGHYLEARDHLHDYSPRSLRRLLEECGFRQVEFVQLPPISRVSGSRSRFLATLKSLWYYGARSLFFLSGQKINLNNLYVIAHK